MQKVRYCLSFNCLNIKFQDLLSLPVKVSIIISLFTVHSHYYSLSILDLLNLRNWLYYVHPQNSILQTTHIWSKTLSIRYY